MKLQNNQHTLIHKTLDRKNTSIASLRTNILGSYILKDYMEYVTTIKVYTDINLHHLIKVYNNPIDSIHVITKIIMPLLQIYYNVKQKLVQCLHFRKS